MKPSSERNERSSRRFRLRRRPSDDAELGPYVITDAEPPRTDEHRIRVRRYITLMSLRIPVLAAAVVVYAVTGIAWLAAGLVALSAPLPWMAVLIANDRLPIRAKTVDRAEMEHGELVEPTKRAGTESTSQYPDSTAGWNDPPAA